MKADLHIHSEYSDGNLSVESLIELLKKNEIRTFSITDHDSIQGTTEAIEIAKNKGLTAIPGIEFSAEFKNREVHILGYRFDFKSGMLEEYLKDIKISRLKRFNEMLYKLNKIGCKLTYEYVKDIFPGNITLGRPHLAKALIKKGYVASLEDAFLKYLGDNKIADVKKKNPNAMEVIELIKELGGKAFLAHPGKHFLWNDIDDLLDSEIDGIEIIHPTHTKTKSDFLRKFADEKNLLICGGSDFHGIYKKDYVNIGKYFIEENELQI